MKTARFSFMRTIFFGLLLLGGALAAQAASDDAGADRLLAHDSAMVECMNQLIADDREVAASLYNGTGFAWTAERDRKIEACMRKKGFRLEDPRESRLGVAGQYDPDQPTAEEVYTKFRQDLLQNVGPEALAEIENYNARFEENAHLPRSTPVPEMKDSSAEKAAEKPAPGKPEEKKKNYLYVPSEKNEGPKPIWLDTQRPD